MTYILENVSQEAVIEAIEGNLKTVAYSLAGSGSKRVTLHDDSDITWYVSDVPFPLANGVMCAKLDAASADSRIDAILAEYTAAAVPMLWWTGPASLPNDISPRLLARGLVLVASPPGMAVDLTKLDANEAPPPGVTIKRLDSDDMVSGYGHVLQQAFGLPDFVMEVFYEILKKRGYDEAGDVQDYLAYLDGMPVATCTVGYGAGVAGIYSVATVEEARGRGIGRAVTLLTLLDARERGYRVGVLEASDMAYNLYKQLGFEEYCRIEQYLFMSTGGQ